MEDRSYKQILFVVFIGVLALTATITLLFLSIFLYDVVYLNKDIEMPPALKWLVSALVLEVCAVVVALFRKLFSLPEKATDLSLGDSDVVASASQKAEVDLTRSSYLDEIVEGIADARKEVLFTSRTMSRAEDEEGQKSIIEASKSFHAQSGGVHRGIIAARPDAIIGAVEVRKELPNIDIKFSTTAVELLDMSYFVVDSKKSIIGTGDGSTNLSVAIDSSALSHILKKHFEVLWDGSIEMGKFIKKTFDEAVDECGEDGALSTVGFASKEEMNKWISDNTILKEETPENDVDVYELHISLSEVTRNNVEGIIKRSLNDATLETSQIEELRRTIHCGASVNYKKLGFAFIYLYFYANYFKCRYTLHRLGKKVSLNEECRLLDLGCGSGATSIAMIDWVRESFHPKKITLHVVDNNEWQIALHKEILAGHYDKNDINIKYVQEDISDFLTGTNIKYDLIMASNVLCELDENKIKLLSKQISESLAPSSGFVLVERRKTGVYELVESTGNLWKTKDERLGAYDLPSDYVFDDPNLGGKSKDTYSVEYAFYVSDQ